MLESVDVGRQYIGDYEATAGREVIERLRSLAEPLRGARVLHLNATPYGGGVAEILRSEVPLMRDLGIACDWKIITGDKDFFSVTKTMHNALQGAKRSITDHEKEIYLTYSTRNAHLLEEEYDLIVAHDPQPLACPLLSRPRRHQVDLEIPYRHLGAKPRTLGLPATLSRGLRCGGLHSRRFCSPPSFRSREWRLSHQP